MAIGTRHPVADPVMAELSQRYIEGDDLTDAEKHTLQKYMGQPYWTEMCAARLNAQQTRHEAEREARFTALFAECLAPVPVGLMSTDQTMIVYAQRQTRLLVEIVQLLRERR